MGVSAVEPLSGVSADEVSEFSRVEKLLDRGVSVLLLVELLVQKFPDVRVSLLFLVELPVQKLPDVRVSVSLGLSLHSPREVVHQVRVEVGVQIVLVAASRKDDVSIVWVLLRQGVELLQVVVV